MDTYKSLKDHVYHYISQKISDGSLLPETKINEKMIIDDLDISRTPVREAMIQLAAEGYLENIPRKGFVVKQVDTAKAKEIYKILGVLEGYAASEAVTHMDGKDLTAMEALYQAMEDSIESDDIRSYYSLQNQFHETFIQKSENQELTRVISLLKKIFIRQTYATTNSKSDLKHALKATNDDHRRIIDLFEQKAGKVLEEHLRNQHWNPKHADYDAF